MRVGRTVYVKAGETEVFLSEVFLQLPPAFPSVSGPHPAEVGAMAWSLPVFRSFIVTPLVGFQSTYILLVLNFTSADSHS